MRRISLVRNYSADARMEQHFRPTMADSGYDVVTENRYYVSGADDRMGGAVLFGQRREVGSRPAAVSAPSGRESAVASAAASIRHRLPLRAARDGGGRRVRVLRDRVRAGRQRKGALSRNRLDRSRDLRARACADGAERASRAGGLERGDAVLHAGGHHRRPARVSVHQDVGPADSDGRRPERPCREERGVHELSREPARLRSGPRRRAREQSRDVQGNRSGTAPLRQGRRGAGRQHRGQAAASKPWRWG